MKLNFKTADGKKSEAQIVGNKALIGRSVKCDVVLKDESLSRQHCFIEIQDGEFYITDVGSANGITIDGTRIAPNERTRFASFSNVILGAVECQVEDTDSTPAQPSFVDPIKTQKQSQSKEQERPTKRMNRDALNTPLKMKNEKSKEQKPKNLNPGMVLAIIGFVAVAFFFFQSEPAKETDIIPAPVVKKAERKIVTKTPLTDTDLRTDAEYITNKSKGNCTSLQFYCDQLRLDGKHHETIFNDNGNYIIYFSPERQLDREEFKALKGKQRASEFVAIFTIFNSTLLDAYILQKISTLHLVVMDGTGKPLTAILIAPKFLNPNSFSRAEFAKSLGETLSSGNMDAFFSKLDPLIKHKEIKE
jgi:pSer/pThr/pTyr-binding forkhead associated (FHA) protein